MIPFLFSRMDRKVHRILGVDAVGHRSCSLFAFWLLGTAYLGGGAQRITVARARWGSRRRVGVVRRIAHADFWPTYFFSSFMSFRVYVDQIEYLYSIYTYIVVVSTVLKQ